jgi:hypothetical protein
MNKIKIASKYRLKKMLLLYFLIEIKNKIYKIKKKKIFKMSIINLVDWILLKT